MCHDCSQRSVRIDPPESSSPNLHEGKYGSCAPLMHPSSPTFQLAVPGDFWLVCPHCFRRGPRRLVTRPTSIAEARPALSADRTRRQRGHLARRPAWIGRNLWAACWHSRSLSLRAASPSAVRSFPGILPCMELSADDAFPDRRIGTLEGRVEEGQQCRGNGHDGREQLGL